MTEVTVDAGAAIPQRRKVETPFGSGSLDHKNLLDGTDYVQPIRVLPDVNIIKVGGQSIMDRGRAGLFPLIDEIGACARSHQMVIGAGGGTRARHAYAIGLELGLPTGVLAAIGASTALQNARILQMLLAKHGGIYINPEDFEKLPQFLRAGAIPIVPGMPPYRHWEKPPALGRIPANRTDSGVYLTAEFLGARSCIYVKDEDGLFTEDPKKNPKAEFIPRITAQELFDRDLNDLVVERIVLTNMMKASHVREIQIINGLVPGNLTRALAGEHVGTIVTAPCTD
jgi:molybdenum storage protein